MFLISARNIALPHSKEYPQSEVRKYNVYPSKPQVYHTKVGFNGVVTTGMCKHDESLVKSIHHGNISVQKLPKICTLHIVKMGEIWGWYQNDKK